MLWCPRVPKTVARRVAGDVGWQRTDRQRRQAFDRDGPVWPPQSNSKDGRSRVGSGRSEGQHTPTKITTPKITTPKIRPTRITLPTKSHQQKSHKNFLLFVSFRSGTALRVVGSGRGAGDIGRERDPHIQVCRRCGAAGYIGRGPGLLACRVGSLLR